MADEQVRPWARHYLDVWLERAGDPRLPPWLRVAALAYGSHWSSGHSPFKSGQIALVLGGLDPDTGEFLPYKNVSRAIAVAVEFGLLAPGSYHRCLIVPGYAVKRGDLYAIPKPCRLEEEHRRRRT